MERKLASVQRILSIDPIEGADAIEKATVLGWQVVVKKGEFNVGDLAVYFEIDSFLPIAEQFEFLRKSCFKVLEGREGFRLKTIKLRKTLSQGLLLSLSILPLKAIGTALEGLLTYQEGDDVTDILDVIKWEPPVPAQLAGKVKGSFPSFIPKTDEIRIQSCPLVLEEIKDIDYYITEKADGTSMTVFIKTEEVEDEDGFKTLVDYSGVCSRNLELKKESEDEGNTYWQMEKKYDIIEKLMQWSREYNKDYAVQCEVVGPGIQSNKLGLKECEIRVFSLYNITDNKYEGYEGLSIFCNTLDLPMVKVVGEGIWPSDMTVDKLLELAKGNYDSGHPREGIVIRPKKESYSMELRGRLSFKAINNDFLLKEKE